MRAGATPKRKLRYKIVDRMLTALILGAIFILPLIPSILLWYFLSPVTFWERLVTIFAGVAAYVIVLVIEVAVGVIMQ